MCEEDVDLCWAVEREGWIAKVVGQYPNFNRKQSMINPILDFEQLVPPAYETSSSQLSKRFHDSKSLLRCAPEDQRSLTTTAT